jgi:hypothetical protein
MTGTVLVICVAVLVVLAAPFLAALVVLRVLRRRNTGTDRPKN